MNLNDFEKSKKFFEEGNKKYDIDNFEGALVDYSKSIYFDPNNVDAYFNRGSIRKELRDLESAKSDFSKVISLSPSNEIAYFNRGEIFFELRDYFRAIDDYTKVIFFNQEDEDAFFKRGLSKAKINNLTGAIEDFSKAIEINPEYVKAIYSRGLIKFKLSDNSSEKDLKDALEIESDYKDTYFDEITKYMNEEEKSKAIDVEVENPTDDFYYNQKKLITNKTEKSYFSNENKVSKKKDKKKIKKQTENENINVVLRKDKSPISGGFILMFFLITSVITAILLSNGLVFEAIIVAFAGSILINIFALFWRPARKAIGLLNIIAGIIMMLSIIGIPFGVILLLFGGILFFI